MSRCFAVVLIALLSYGSSVAADTTEAAQGRDFRPIWTVIGAAAGFGLGAWIGLTKFDDAINSDRKVWTTAIVGAAAGGVLGFLLDRHQSRSANPFRTSSSAPPSDRPLPWREAVYGSAASTASLRLPAVSELLQR